MQNVLPLRWRRVPGLLPRVAPDPRPVGAAEPDPSPAAVAAGRSDQVVMSAHGNGRALTVGAIELRSLASIALRCAVVVTAAVGTGVLALWLLAVATGVVDRTESFMQSIGFRDFQISGAAVILGLICVVAGLALFAGVLLVVAGAAYNVLAHHGRGLRIRMDGFEVADEGNPSSLLERGSRR